MSNTKYFYIVFIGKNKINEEMRGFYIKAIENKPIFNLLEVKNEIESKIKDIENVIITNWIEITEEEYKELTRNV